MRKLTSFVLSAALFAAYSEPVLGAGDAVKGKEVFAKCAVCHQIGRGAGTQVGPELNGIVGRKAASVDYPMYSDELKILGELGVVWTEENIDKLVANPKIILPHSPMSVFPGVPEASDRADLIAYLKTEPSRRD
jgi:cytochrome c